MTTRSSSTPPALAARRLHFILLGASSPWHPIGLSGGGSDIVVPLAAFIAVIAPSPKSCDGNFLTGGEAAATAYEIGLFSIQELKGANTVAKQLGKKPTTSWPRGDPISLSAAGPEHVVAECGYRSPIVSAPLYSHAPGLICAVISSSGVAEGIC